MQPEKEVFDEYSRSVSFLKGLNITEKLPLATDKVVASQFLSPSSSPYGDSVSKEIHHKVSAQYTNQVRDELMKTKPATSTACNERDKTQEFDNPTSIVKQDLNTLEKSNTLAEDNENTLLTQTAILKERSGFCARCWVWLFLILVVCSFIAMVIFMRLFKKRVNA